jgi:mannitol-specific phosphotransferase system IIBC component
MNFWDPHFLKELSTNNSVIVFDSRGIGNTTLGNKPFTISQFANDTAGLLDALKINKKVDVLGFSLGSLTAQVDWIYTKVSKEKAGRNHTRCSNTIDMDEYLEEDEVQKLIESIDSVQKKAFISCMYESGAMIPCFSP